MKINLWFKDWVCQKTGKKIDFTEELSLGDLHSGTVISATIDVDEYDEKRIILALEKDISPVFEIVE